ncbi:PGL/p-HBAD biosynthesis glycosyltransferase Rv2957/MT3031 [Porphyromonas endodontalis]|nr:glycosyltransferase [Porphyromonas endodontalis]SUB76476.1 PGL/p-HBAD biosynthesis glycosyltransferase Rv2957/MT3031 [Porphyromonas endodontalis]
MIKISLITICYNAESTLLPTLESVARQTYPHIEYIVVDGASRDNSLDLVRSICPEALITSEPDRGLYDAMNKGICRATGDYIWFLNAGDSLRRETTVQEVVEAIEQGSAPDIVYGDTMIVDEERKELGLRRLRPLIIFGKKTSYGVCWFAIKPLWWLVVSLFPTTLPIH